MLLSFLDARTLLTCECMLAIVFATVFLGMHRAYSQVRGVRSIALSFLLVIPETILLALRGHISPVLSILVANPLMLAALISMYEAILRFTGGRNHRRWLWAATFACFGVLFFYTEIRPDIRPRIIAVSLAMAVIRLFTARALLRQSRQSTQRNTLRFFGSFMIALACLNLDRMLSAIVRGGPADLLQADAVQSISFGSGVLYLSVAGLCFLILASNELVIRTRMEAYQDPLSKTFNRRGLEVNLALELERVRERGQVLSIALVDIDHFKRINDEEGHAAGDAAIREIAATIASRLRGSDFIGRFGGDEFLLIFPQTGTTEALIVADRFAGELARRRIGEGERQFTLSVGITEAGAEDTAEQLISRADKALYQAKSDGRNCRRVVLREHSAMFEVA